MLTPSRITTCMVTYSRDDQFVIGRPRADRPGLDCARLTGDDVVIGVAGVLLAAGILAGAAGSAGGITSLISYPALLAVGLPPLAANVANLVASVACWPGSAMTSRLELTGTGRWLAYGLPVAAAGGAIGAGILLSTPAGVFARVVPFLVVTGSLALLLQP